jgi:hypothetical protein
MWDWLSIGIVSKAVDLSYKGYNVAAGLFNKRFTRIEIYNDSIYKLNLVNNNKMKNIRLKTL